MPADALQSDFDARKKEHSAGRPIPPTAVKALIVAGEYRTSSIRGLISACDPFSDPERVERLWLLLTNISCGSGTFNHKGC
jgi:hypothetical protein